MVAILTCLGGAVALSACAIVPELRSDSSELVANPNTSATDSLALPAAPASDDKSGPALPPPASPAQPASTTSKADNQDRDAPRPPQASSQDSTEKDTKAENSNADNKNSPLDDADKDKDPNKPTINLRGLIQTDALFVTQSQKDQEILGNLQNATGFRRARLGADGTVGEQVNWSSIFDFAGGEINFKDVYVGVDELPYVRRARIGHMCEPFSLEGATSTNFFPFVERSPIMALDPSFSWGVAFFSYTDDERATFSAGAFRSGSNGAGDDIDDGNDMAYIVRVTGLPWYDEASCGRYLMHLGAAVSQVFPHDDIVSINQGPQSSLLPISDNPGSPFLPTITIASNSQQLFNLEWAMVLGSFSMEAEWSATNIEQIGGGPVFLHGSYVFASWYLTGENRQYLTRDGAFGMTHVLRPFVCMNGKQHWAKGPGAWELLVRFAYTNFASPNIPPNNGLQVGDRLAEYTVGLNWYLNDNTRIMFNWLHAVPVDPNFGPSYGDEFAIETAIFW
jgi:phosphate-selective porin OprO/OprP